jgi:hypothetical protein
LLLVASPPLFLSSEYKWTATKYWFYMFAVTLWTSSTLLIKFYTLLTLGQIPYQYLVVYPVMFYFEWIIPALYVFVGIKYYKPVSRRRPTRVSNRARFDDDIDDDVARVHKDNRERFDD